MVNVNLRLDKVLENFHFFDILNKHVSKGVKDREVEKMIKVVKAVEAFQRRFRPYRGTHEYKRRNMPS